MKTITPALLKNLLSDSPNPYKINLTLYRKFPSGEITYRSAEIGTNRRYIKVYGDATTWFPAGTKCIVTCYDYLTEVEVYSSSYASGYTTIYFTNTSILNYIGNSPAYICKKYEVSKENIILDDIGSIDRRLDIPTLSFYDCGVLDLALFNEDSVYWDEANKAGIMFNDTFDTIVDSVSGSTITLQLASEQTITDDVLIGHKIVVLDGVEEGEEYIITDNTAGVCSVYPTTPYDNGLRTDDNIRLVINNEFIAKVDIKTKGFTESINLYSGIIRSQGIVFNSIKNCIYLCIDGFVKELDDTLASEACDRTNFAFYTLKGIEGFKYGVGTSEIVNNGERIVSFNVKEPQVTGFKPTDVAPSTREGWHILFYKPPSTSAGGYQPAQFRLNKGYWVTRCGATNEERDDPAGVRVYVYDADHLNKIYGNFSRADFPAYPSISFIHVNKGNASAISAEINDLTLKVDEGGEEYLQLSPIRVVRDNTYVSGVYYAADITFEESACPLKIVVASATNRAFYIGVISPINTIFFELLKNSIAAALTVTWEYSKIDGTWGALSVEDTTGGLLNSGNIRFDTPVEWAPLSGVGTGGTGESGAVGEVPIYWIRGRIDSSVVTEISLGNINIGVRCLSDFGDFFDFKCNSLGLPSSSTEDAVVLARSGGNNGIISSVIGGTYKGATVYEVVDELVKNSTLFKNRIINIEHFQTTGENKTLTSLENIPAGIRDVHRYKICSAVYTAGGIIYFAIKNEVWQFTQSGGFKRTGSVPYEYEIVSLRMSPIGNYLMGVAVLVGSQFSSAMKQGTVLFYFTNLTISPAMIHAPYELGIVDSRFFLLSGARTLAGAYAHYHCGHRLIDLTHVTIRENLNVIKESMLTSFNSVVQCSHLESLVRIKWEGDFPAECPLPLHIRQFPSLTSVFEVGSEPPQSDAGFKYTIGQNGVFVPSFYAFNSWLLMAKYEQLPDRYAPYLQIYDSTGAVATGIPKPQRFGGLDYASFLMHFRGHAMDAEIGKVAEKETWLCLQQDREINVGLTLFESDLMQYGWLEQIVVWNKIGSPLSYGVKPYKIYFGDSSAGTYTDVTNETSVTIEQGDQLYIYGGMRFTNVYIDGTLNSGAIDMGLGYWNPNLSTWVGFAMPWASLWGGSGQTVFEYDMPPMWRKGNVAAIGAVNQWILRLRQAAVGVNWTINPSTIKLHTRQLWGSEEYSGGNYQWLTPLESCYDATNDYLYVVLLHRKYNSFKIGAINLSASPIRTTLHNGLVETMVLAASYPTEWDATMRACNFCFNSADGKMYFVLEDHVSKRKTAMLFTASFNGSVVTIAFVCKLVEGCWGCSELAIYNDAIYGVVYNKEKHYWFEYSYTHNLRSENFSFDRKTTREALSELVTQQMLSFKASDERNIIIEHRFPSLIGATITNLDSDDEIADIGKITPYEEFYDRVEVSYANGRAIYGNTYRSFNTYAFDAKFIKSYQNALEVAKLLYKELGYRRRYTDIKTNPLYFFELKDLIKLRTNISEGYVDRFKVHMVVGVTFDIRDGSYNMTLLEVI